MSEEIWTNVTIKVPAEWMGDRMHNEGDLPEPLRSMAEYLGEEIDLYFQGEPEQRYTPNPPPLSDTVAIIHLSGGSNYGICGVQEWLDQLTEWHIPFEARSEPKYEFEGEVHLVDGTGRLYYSTCNGDGVPLMDESTWQEVGRGEHPWADTVERYFHPPTLEDFTIDHLLGTPNPFVKEDA